MCTSILQFLQADKLRATKFSRLSFSSCTYEIVAFFAECSLRYFIKIGEKRLYLSGRSIKLVPRFSLLPVERPWLGLVTCLPESGRLQTNDLGEGRISVRFVSTKCRCRDQWKPCLKGPVFYSSRTSQDKTSNAESLACVASVSVWFRSKEMQNIWMFIGCCKGNPGFTTCAFKNILGGCIHTETQ